MPTPIAIPEDPAEFFERFFPEQFAKDRHRYRRNDSPGCALFDVVGAGSWGIRRVGDGLLVTRGKPADTLVQISLSADDFKAVFVERTRREVDTTGDISDDSRDVFRPLFPGPEATAAIAGADATLAFRLSHDGATRHLFITPGPLERTRPRTIISMQLYDLLALLSGPKGFASLLLWGKLKVHGDVLYAKRMSTLLAG